MPMGAGKTWIRSILGVATSTMNKSSTPIVYNSDAQHDKTVGNVQLIILRSQVLRLIGMYQQFSVSSCSWLRINNNESNFKVHNMI